MAASPRKQQRAPFVPDRTWHTSTRLAFPPPPVTEIGRTQSYAPHLQYQPNPTPLGLSSNRAEYPAYPVSKRESFRPPQVPSAFGYKSATTVTTARMSYEHPPLSPTKSYAPHLQYQPNNAPLGLSSNRAEYPPYQIAKRASFQPPQVPSALGTKAATTVTTARMSYEHPPLSPTKSYAPTLQYQPNNAPLGLSTNRAEYPAYPVSKRESFRPQVVPTAFPHFQ